MIKYDLEVTTNCCDSAKINKVVVLRFPPNPDYVQYKLLKPIWMSNGFTEDRFYKGHFINDYIEVKYCPFCGCSLPDIELNIETKNCRFYEIDDSEYCFTCGDRNMNCDCIPPTFRWKPVDNK